MTVMTPHDLGAVERFKSFSDSILLTCIIAFFPLIF